jgi:crotonobetaine/carnitine-CoA ligase
MMAAKNPINTDGWTLVAALRSQARALGEAPFVTFEGETPISFSALDRISDACATGLAQLGVGPGDRVALMADNSAAYLTLLWAVQKRRAILVPINTELTGELLAHQLRDSAPKVIASDHHLEELAALKPESVQAIVSLAPLGAPIADISLDTLCATTEAHSVLDPEASDICLVLYTSGTSGRSKGVLIPQAHAYLFGLQQARTLGVSNLDRFFIALPLFHVNALVMSLGCCLIMGAQAFVCRKFSASRWLEQVRACEATVTNCLGIMAEFLLRQVPTPGDRDHRLRAVMAVPVLAQWAHTFESRFGVRLVQVYGMTECNIVSYSSPSDPLEAGCVGSPSADFFEVGIVNPDDDHSLPTGSIGEIVVRPKVPSGFMQGYLGQPETTVKAWRNLWFHTGDGGWLDERGRLHFAERIGDFIRRRGENISPAEIEQVLASHPGVAECAVVGIRVEGAGGEDEVMAYVVPDRTRPSPAALLDWSRERLPRYAVPRFWQFVDEIEKTPTGKVKKRELRQRGVAASTWDRERGD